MRLRTRRAAVANDNQLPLPFAARTRHGASQLCLPEVPDIEVPLKGAWSNDLAAVQRGTMSFDVLVKRHQSLIRSIVRPWLKRCPLNVGGEDLAQEALLEVWQGIKLFDPTRGVPLHHYVRQRMKNRLLALTHRLKKGAERDNRFLTQQIVEEKVIVLHRGYHLHHDGIEEDYRAAYEAVAPTQNPEGFDAARTAARIVGGLPSKQARVVAGVVFGESADEVTQRVYGAKCKRPRKAALRAFAAAHALVESSATAEVAHLADRQRTNHVAHPHESIAEEADRQAAFEYRSSEAEGASAHAGEGE